jgi:uncharacterized OsmC-like protein
LRWTALTCSASGTLDRIDRRPQFTAFSVNASLEIRDDASEDEAMRVLRRAEAVCLITNSLKASCHLEVAVHVAQEVG